MGANMALTPPELLHLSLHASAKDQPDKALQHLKQLLEIEPDNAKATYMMGALHAEIGMYEKAIEELRRAEELDASMVTATFQLGLLLLTQGEVEEAALTWNKLEMLGDSHALVLFKKGMLHLVKDEFDDCISALDAGIAANDFNDDLNSDMQRVINDAHVARGRVQGIENSSEDDSKSSGHSLLMNAYGHEDTEH